MTTKITTKPDIPKANQATPEQRAQKSGLYLVSTPIGNLEDITLRAIKQLQSSDVILCEDTRVSRKLLAKHNINIPLFVYNDKSNESSRIKIIQMIESGQMVSLISDAGTPLISDPGYKLVRQCHELGLHVDIVPGVSAPIAALSLSGLPSDSFFFGGFLPKTSTQRQKKFRQTATYDATLIFFETASRIAGAVEDALKILGPRQAVITRELTKLFQERIDGNLEFITQYFKEHKIKGEVVLLISSAHLCDKNISDSDTNESRITDLDRKIRTALASGDSAKNIADDLFNQQIIAKNSLTKSEVYKRVNLIKAEISK